METMYNLNDNSNDIKLINKTFNQTINKTKSSEKPHIIKKVDHFHIYLDISLGQG